MCKSQITHNIIHNIATKDYHESRVKRISETLTLSRTSEPPLLPLRIQPGNRLHQAPGSRSAPAAAAAGRSRCRCRRRRRRGGGGC
uniref:Uncharacterized protein n=1 Tax=Triticum urartu TaxID=4572 RepID=A0A8R7U9M8_TRIUA